MRPTQWIKNGFVLMPLIFSGRLFVVEDVTKVVGMCLAFCLASSATYILNDYMDMEQDRAHPLKKNRPLAAGLISPRAALSVMCLLIVGIFVLALAVKIPPWGFIFLGIYLVLHALYSFKLKDLVLVDVLTISVGFCLVLGAVVIGVTVSESACVVHFLGGNSPRSWETPPRGRYPM